MPERSDIRCSSRTSPTANCWPSVCSAMYRSVRERGPCAPDPCGSSGSGAGAFTPDASTPDAVDPSGPAGRVLGALSMGLPTSR
ncbi:hypothetical protein GCM10007079_10030 [Nocardiopsis terrae]|nr:hypothetical protein GCM10007079_10030 [Nocardiopsis terrae]